MTRPFYASDPAWWPAIAGALAASGAPWPIEAIYNDLRWWQDQEHAGKATRPGRTTLRRRWGVTDHAAKMALKDEAVWGDPKKTIHQPVASPSPASRQRSTSTSPASDASNLDNREESTSAAPAIHQPTASSPPGDRPTRVDPQPTTHNPQPTEESAEAGASARTAGLPIPKWVSDEVKTAKGFTGAEILAGVVAVLDVLRKDPCDPKRCKSEASHVLKLWKAEERPPWSTLLAEARLVARGAREGRHGIFARDIRAEGWENGTDRRYDVDTLCVQGKWRKRVDHAREEFGGTAGEVDASPALAVWHDLTSRPHVSPPCKSFAQFVVVLRQDDLSQWQDRGRIRLADDMPEHHRRYRALLGAGALGRSWETDHADPVKRAAIRDDFARRYTELSARGAA